MTRQLLTAGAWIVRRLCESFQICTDDGWVRGTCVAWADRYAKSEDRKGDKFVPVCIRSRGDRPVNRFGKSFGNRDSARFWDSDRNAVETAKL